jgi:predicted TIM-barrel fold metal-dependent hydrolase
MSEGWSGNLFCMAHYKPNLATDFSRWQIAARNDYPHFCKCLREALDSFGAERVIFGTDGPYLRLFLADRDYVQMIKDLPTQAPEGISFTEAEVEAVLGGNAKRILGLGTDPGSA